MSIDLFKPFNLAGITLNNRIVMAPMTRSRAPHNIADERTALYYTQRVTAGLIITEGTPISREGQGYLFNPGIHNTAQIDGWKLTTDSVHAAGGKIFAQLWHVGRLSHPTLQAGGQLPVSPSSYKANGGKAFAYDNDGKPGLIDVLAPRALKTEEIPRLVADFAQAAKNAVAAGFDGVEIHGANGYLLEQFMNPLVNDRSDDYAATTIEGRLRFTLEVIDAVVAAIGANRVGIRLSPYGQLFDMPRYRDIDATYLALAQAIGARRLAFVHLMNQSGFARADRMTETVTSDGFFDLTKAIRPHLQDTVLILAGGMTRERAQELIDSQVIDLAAFGANFISNPDLVARLRHGWPLTPAEHSTFYGGGAEGYIDYPPYHDGKTAVR